MEYQYFEKFEYKVLKIPSYNPEGFLNMMGKEGWELIGWESVNFLNSKAIFKGKLNCAKDIINE